MSALAETSTVVLPSVLDLKAAAPLLQELLSHRGGPLAVNAREVTRVGGLGLQVLMAAKAAWKADEQSFDIVDPSEDFLNALQLFGAPELEAATLEEPRP